MNRPLSTYDTVPWYKQFWPWFIFLLPASVVVAGITTVIIANQHADDLVADEYYKTGLAINRELEKRERAQQLAITARFTIDSETVILKTVGPVESHSLLLTLSHPMEADRDFSVTLGRLSAGEYAGVLPQRIGPHWHWRVENPADSQWRLDGVLNTSDFSP
ncbi:MAG: FixH family protein [Halioglobus sp.]